MVSQFVAREEEMQALEQLLIDAPVATCRRRKVVVVHGLGAIGKQGRGWEACLL
jgi:hypothetical protein